MFGRQFTQRHHWVQSQYLSPCRCWHSSGRGVSIPLWHHSWQFATAYQFFPSIFSRIVTLVAPSRLPLLKMKLFRSCFVQMPPSQRWFSFIPSPSVCSSLLQSSSLCLLHVALWLWPSSHTITQDLASGKCTPIANTLRHEHVDCPWAFCSMTQEFSLFYFPCWSLLFYALCSCVFTCALKPWNKPDTTLWGMLCPYARCLHWSDGIFLFMCREYWRKAFPPCVLSLTLMFTGAFSYPLNHHACIFPSKSPFLLSNSLRRSRESPA